jgi:hypothetical protein
LGADVSPAETLATWCTRRFANTSNDTHSPSVSLHPTRLRASQRMRRPSRIADAGLRSSKPMSPQKEGAKSNAWTTIAADFASRRSLWEPVTPECAKRAGPRWMRLVLCVPFRTVRYWGRLRMEARRHVFPGTPIKGGREIAQISQLAAVSRWRRRVAPIRLGVVSWTPWVLQRDGLRRGEDSRLEPGKPELVSWEHRILRFLRPWLVAVRGSDASEAESSSGQAQQTLFGNVP